MSLPPGFDPRLLPRPPSPYARLAWTLIVALLAGFATAFGAHLGWELAGRALQ